MVFPWAAVIPAVSSLAGAGIGALGAAGAQGQQAAQFQQSAQFAQQQLAFQDAAAKNGVQWRVADAKAAGISPLVALGMSPIQAPVQGFSGGGVPSDPTDYAGALGRAGQDISAAIGRTSTAQEKEDRAIKLSTMAQASQKNQAEINTLNAQANYYNSRAAGTPSMASSIPGGGFNMPGQPQSGLVPSNVGPPNVKGNEVYTASGDTREAGAGPPGPTTNWHVTGDGLQAFPAKVNGLDDMEASNFLGLDWQIRNRWVGPNLGLQNPPDMAKVRSVWPNATGVYWNYSTQTYKPLFNNEKSGLQNYMSWRNQEFKFPEKSPYRGDWQKWAF